MLLGTADDEMSDNIRVKVYHNDLFQALLILSFIYNNNNRY